MGLNPAAAKRGEIWTVAGGAEFARKPRPVLVVQADEFPSTASVTVCPITSNLKNLPQFRIPVAPDPDNGLRLSSHVMVDKVSTVDRSRLGRRIGALAEDGLEQTSRALVVFLGLING